MTIYSEFSHKNMVIFHSYVNLPEGKNWKVNMSSLMSQEKSVFLRKYQISHIFTAAPQQTWKRTPKETVSLAGESLTNETSETSKKSNPISSQLDLCESQSVPTRPGKHTKNYGKSPCFYGKTHYKWSFSIAMLVITRGYLNEEKIAGFDGPLASRTRLLRGHSLSVRHRTTS